MKITINISADEPKEGGNSEIKLVSRAIEGYMASISNIMERAIKSRSFPNDGEMATLLNNSGTAQSITTKLGEATESFGKSIGEYESEPLNIPVFTLTLSMKTPDGGGFSEVALFHNVIGSCLGKSTMIDAVADLGMSVNEEDQTILTGLFEQLESIIKNRFDL
ncbi:MAG: hypothetical protein KKG00_05145 [Bacteroidetes bacterium]|nr:hypothetical protein [Bacteroidota bacterium]